MPILHWLNKDEHIKADKAVPYRVLEPNLELSCGDDTENMIIQGDNLDALKSLLPYYAGKVKCIFIDPPYNVRKDFGHYNDNLEHSQWLEMIYPRIVLLRQLLAEDGSIWVSIDDDEGHYLKVIMDEIFGRNNFISNVIWQKKYSPQNDAKWLSDNHDHIFVYAKNKNVWRPNLLPRTEKQNKAYKNPDNDSRGVWTPSDLSVKTYNVNMDYPITTPSDRIVNPPNSRCWGVSKEKFQILRDDNRIWFGADGNNVPTLKRFLTDVKQGITSMTIWTYEEVGHNTNAKKEVKEFNSLDVFATPKPEKLLQRILHLASNKGDLVLDSFLGSGTTCAVSQKMGRKYIGIEMGEHAKTHCVPRLQKVVDGEQGGISKDLNWTGGGGYKFYSLGEEIYDADGQINKQIKFPTLARHIWFSETKTALATEPAHMLLGKNNDTAYILLYNGILGDRRPTGGNVLTRIILQDILNTLTGFTGNIIVYGESCRLGKAVLEQNKIEFKQTPYDVKA